MFTVRLKMCCMLEDIRVYVPWKSYRPVDTSQVGETVSDLFILIYSGSYGRISKVLGDIFTINLVV